MDARTAAGGAAALLLRPDQIGRARAAQREPVRQLRWAVGADLLDLLDGWAQPGATGEQLLCAADVLRVRSEEEPTLARLLAAVALDDESLEALAELAGSFQRSGQWAAAAWCSERYAEIRPSVGPASTAPAVLPAPSVADLETRTRAAEEILARLCGPDPDVDPGRVDEETAEDTLAIVLSACAGDDLPAARFDPADLLSPRSA